MGASCFLDMELILNSHTFLQSEDDFEKAVKAANALYLNNIAPGKVIFLGHCNYFGLITGFSLVAVSLFASGSAKVAALYIASIVLLGTQLLFIYISRLAEKQQFEISKSNFSLDSESEQTITIDHNEIRFEKCNGSSGVFGSWRFVSHIFSIAQHIVVVANGQFIVIPIQSFSTEDEFNDFCLSLEKYSNKKILVINDQNN